MSTRLEPRAQQRDVRRAADTVSALDDDQFATELFLLNAR